MLGEYSEEEYEEMFQKIKKYLNLNSRMNKVQTSRATGVPMEVIEKFIEDGRLELKFGAIGFQKPNSKGMSEERRRELAEALYGQMNEDSRTRKADSGSKLVKDLNKKYNNSREER